MDWVHLAYKIGQWKTRVSMSNLGSVTGEEFWNQLCSFSRRDVPSCHVPASTLSWKKVMSVRELALHASGLIITTLSECNASCPKSEVLLVTAVPSWSAAVSSTQHNTTVHFNAVTITNFSLIGILTLFAVVMSNSRTVFFHSTCSQGLQGE